MRIAAFIWHLLIGWGGLIIGGIYTAILGFKQMVTGVDELLYRFYDYPVYEIINTPMPMTEVRFGGMIRTSLGTIVKDTTTREMLGPYSVGEIAKRLGRKEKRVLRYFETPQANG